MFRIVHTVKAFLEKNKVVKYNEEDMKRRAPKYDGFVKPMHIKIRDFPEEDFDLNEEL
ncbi:uncharacterized protein LOC105185835 [Harpegnathos saltator]|uniref:uncharacterized protein LOC105185835 n=1 Tax=Harpegnathos saltator TaxID=610380 RepID=UPI00058FDE61|nr:uncharacterized protein LOC105185835 [Harpegnathos saltator]